MASTASGLPGVRPAKTPPTSALTHNLANHGSLPDLDDVQELVVYLTLLLVVLSWMLREIHLAFFTGEAESTLSRGGVRSESSRARQPSATEDHPHAGGLLRLDSEMARSRSPHPRREEE